MACREEEYDEEGEQEIEQGGSAEQQSGDRKKRFFSKERVLRQHILFLDKL